METDPWREVSRHLLATPIAPYHLTSLAFDTVQELLWVGNEYGRVQSFYGPELQKYTSYRGHEAAVRQIQFSDRGVISLSATGVHFANRRGLTQWNLKNENMKDLTSMSFANRGTTEMLVGGLQDSILRINLDRGQVTNEYPSETRIRVMKRSQRFICCGTETGQVKLLDMNSCQVIKQLPGGHIGAIADMDTQNNVLLTCGYSPRTHNSMNLDPLVNVYDLRTYRPLPPIPFHAGALFVRMHPKMSNTAMIFSQSGQFHMVDISNPPTVALHHANTSGYLTCVDLAPSGDAVAFADTEGIVQLWGGSPEKMRFTDFSNPIEWPDVSSKMIPPPPPPPPQPASIIVDEDVPLNSIGMPYYRDPLLSAWPTHMVFNVGKPPPKIDPDILATIKPGGYVPFPKRTRRYQVDNTGVTTSAELTAPKFLSEKAKGGKTTLADFEAEFSGEDRSKRRLFDIPRMYKKLEIKYSKFGVEDFDFQFYNKTRFSGLETHITNSYCNSLVQLFKFTPLIRNIALQHTATGCLQETCLMCQLGFLFDMLEKAKGLNCQASNFLRTFSCIHQASALHLLEEETSKNSYSTMIQSLNRFLLDRIGQDVKTVQPHLTTVDDVLGTVSTTHIRCTHCGNETNRCTTSPSIEFIYNKPTKKGPLPDFSTILKQSVGREANSRGWCDKCRRYQQLISRKSVQRLPKVLMINAQSSNMDSKMFWAKPGWVPAEIGLNNKDGAFTTCQGEKLENAVKRGEGVTVYELVGFVAEIKDDTEQNNHLVSFIDVNRYGADKKAPEWYLFNDFLVNPVSVKDALDFTPTWKSPAILCYQARSAENVFDDSWKDNLDKTVLFHDYSMLYSLPALFMPTQTNLYPSARVPVPTSPIERAYTTLEPSEAPKPGSLVALDAEFVALQLEEIEVRADGTREIIRPSRLGLGRVSVLRGEGLKEGEAFIDEYIITREPVVDYLTDYSGIHPGDLEPGRSKKPLVPLKVAYKKLWLLLNSGCVFVGHGLVKDFRTINIHVPKEQVLDTVLLFSLKSSQRKLSLRFLAYSILGQLIQTDMHDSIEDSKTALRLYRKFQEFEDAGILEVMLNRIFAEGRDCGFKVPEKR